MYKALYVFSLQSIFSYKTLYSKDVISLDKYTCKGYIKIILLDSEDRLLPLAYLNIVSFENCNNRKIAYMSVNEKYINMKKKV